MPKVKIHSGAKKRFRLTASGKLKRKHACKGHNLAPHKKSRRQKRALTHMTLVHQANMPRIKALLHL